MLTTILGYLASRREAGRVVANAWWALPLGLTFVALAAWARLHDRDSFGAWEVAGPFIAPLANALAAWLATAWTFCAPLTPRGLLAFGGLFTMTAPTGWLFALPLDAVLPGGHGDLAVVAVISGWRMCIVAHALAAATGCGKAHAWAPVTLASAVVILPFLLASRAGTAMTYDLDLLMTVLGWSTVPTLLSLPLLFAICAWFRRHRPVGALL